MGWAALLIVVAIVSGVAIGLTSPRFEIDTPSLVDDWSAISISPSQLDEIATLTNPEEQRFRPSWILWNYVQWHTFGAPQSLAGPNVWSLLRLVVFVGGLSLLTWLALPRARTVADYMLRAALAGIPALVTVTTPNFAVDLARFGPQETLLLGGMALGGSLLVLAARELFDARRAVVWPAAAALGFVGACFWVIGMYQKETSLAAIPLVVAVCLAGRHRLSEWRDLTSARRFGLGAVGAVVVLPFVHVVVESLRIVSRGDLVYEGEIDGGAVAARGAGELYRWAHEALPLSAQLCVVGAVVLTLVAVLAARTVDVLAIGALLSSVLAIVLAGQAGVVATRYYIPAFVLALVALVLSLARFSWIVQVVGLTALAVACLPAVNAFERVQAWADGEKEAGELVRAVADAQASGCIVAAAGLDLEAEQALPVIVGLYAGPSPSVCGNGNTYLVRGPNISGAALLDACARGGATRLVAAAGVASLYRCERLSTKPVQEPTLGAIDPRALVELRRLRI